MIHFAGTTLKMLFWLNGGAAVAMLAFLGNIWSKCPGSVIASGIIKALWFFCLGIVVSVICCGFSYFCQVCFTEISKHQRLGSILRIIAVLCGCMPSEPHGEGDIAVELWKKLEPGEK